VTGQAGSNELVWVSREGAVEEVDAGWSGLFFDPAISPNGEQLAIRILGDGESQIWIKQLNRGPLAKLTFEPLSNIRPSWTPDGRTVVFLTDRGANWDLFRRRADGSVVAEPVLDEEVPLLDVLFSSDDEWLVYRAGRGLWARRRGNDSTAAVPLVEPAVTPALSADGRWLAYMSNETGRPEVYVRPFPDTDRGKWLVSTGGGQEPVWAHSGRELFYRSVEGDLVSVDVLAGPTFVAGERRTLFSANEFRADVTHAQYDVSPDDQRFIMVRLGSSNQGGQLIVVENFFEEIVERVGN